MIEQKGGNPIDELKEIIFQACKLEENAHDKASEVGDLGDAADALIAYTALYAVIKQAGLEEEYEEWLNS